MTTPCFALPSRQRRDSMTGTQLAALAKEAMGVAMSSDSDELMEVAGRLEAEAIAKPKTLMGRIELSEHELDLAEELKAQAARLVVATLTGEESGFLLDLKGDWEPKPPVASPVDGLPQRQPLLPGPALGLFMTSFGLKYRYQSSPSAGGSFSDISDTIDASFVRLTIEDLEHQIDSALRRRKHFSPNSNHFPSFRTVRQIDAMKAGAEPDSAPAPGAFRC